MNPTRHVLSLFLGLVILATGRAGDASDPLARAAAAEASGQVAEALKHYLEAERLSPSDPTVLQKIARQYSDLCLDPGTSDARRALATQALTYAERAVQLAPNDAVNVLSVAISYGKLALFSDAADKVRYSRLIKENAERALALNPDYDFAHHVLGRWHVEVVALGGTKRWLVKVFYGGLPQASLAEGITHLETAARIAPGEPAHAIELAYAYHAAGRDDDARRALERGLRLPSRNRNDDVALARGRALQRTLSP